MLQALNGSVWHLGFFFLFVFFYSQAYILVNTQHWRTELSYQFLWGLTLFYQQTAMRFWLWPHIMRNKVWFLSFSIIFWFLTWKQIMILLLYVHASAVEWTKISLWRPLGVSRVLTWQQPGSLKQLYLHAMLLCLLVIIVCAFLHL